MNLSLMLFPFHTQLSDGTLQLPRNKVCFRQCRFLLLHDDHRVSGHKRDRDVNIAVLHFVG